MHSVEKLQVQGADVALAQPYSVLLVDDTDALRAILAKLLNKSGRIAVTATARNGVEGIAAARKYQPDVILLDLQMPVMDGAEALPGLLAASPRSRVVILSGHEHTHLMPGLARAGASAYVEKGTKSSEIVATILSVMDRPGELTA